jgi:hypothetical protein
MICKRGHLRAVAVRWDAGESMFTGWWSSLKFPLNRPITDDEKKNRLDHQNFKAGSFDAHGALSRLNSTYAEWIDRRYLIRGSATTGIILIALLFFVCWIAYFLHEAFNHNSNMDYFYAYLICSSVGFIAIPILYFAQLRYDFFKKIYYPIRFNRKSRMIYVYRDKRDGGILSVPWDKVYFHVGKGMRDKNLCDIRGEIVEDGVVRDTFALGHYFEQPQPVHQMWNFICNYMEGGPSAVEQDPLDRYITLSVSPSFRNCLMMTSGYYGATNIVVRVISLPFIALATVTRWLVFKTCSRPVWPAAIEDDCKVESNDPHIWSTPKYTGQFAAEVPGLLAYVTAKAKKASGGSSIADQLGDWQGGIRKE